MKATLVAASFAVVALLLSPAVACAASGSLDPAFGTGGSVTTSITTENIAFAVVLQSDGKLVAAGLACNSNFTSCDVALVRYLP